MAAYGAAIDAEVWQDLARDFGAGHGLKTVTFRYFNVAGSDPQGRIGQSTPNATLLIKVAADNTNRNDVIQIANIFDDRIASRIAGGTVTHVDGSDQRLEGRR